MSRYTNAKSKPCSSTVSGGWIPGRYPYQRLSQTLYPRCAHKNLVTTHLKLSLSYPHELLGTVPSKAIARSCAETEQGALGLPGLDVNDGAESSWASRVELTLQGFKSKALKNPETRSCQLSGYLMCRKETSDEALSERDAFFRNKPPKAPSMYKQCLLLVLWALLEPPKKLSNYYSGHRLRAGSSRAGCR